jgi:hypothetical protein
MLFATGAGQTGPPGTDGQIIGDTLPKPLLPVSVKIGSLDAEVLYAGAVPATDWNPAWPCPTKHTTIWRPACQS